MAPTAKLDTKTNSWSESVPIIHSSWNAGIFRKSMKWLASSFLCWFSTLPNSTPISRHHNITENIDYIYLTSDLHVANNMAEWSFILKIVPLQSPKLSADCRWSPPTDSGGADRSEYSILRAKEDYGFNSMWLYLNTVTDLQGHFGLHMALWGLSSILTIDQFCGHVYRP